MFNIWNVCVSQYVPNMYILYSQQMCWALWACRSLPGSVRILERVVKNQSHLETSHTDTLLGFMGFMCRPALFIRHYGHSARGLCKSLQAELKKENFELQNMKLNKCKTEINQHIDTRLGKSIMQASLILCGARDNSITFGKQFVS